MPDLQVPRKISVTTFVLQPPFIQGVLYNGERRSRKSGAFREAESTGCWRVSGLNSKGEQKAEEQSNGICSVAMQSFSAGCSLCQSF